VPVPAAAPLAITQCRATSRVHGGRQRDTERGRRGKQYVTDRGDPARLGARKGRDAVAARMRSRTSTERSPPLMPETAQPVGTGAAGVR
jgi:hypothetical protein